MCVYAPFRSVLNRLTGLFAEDRAAFIASLDEYDLLIIDGLGVERSTDYAMEQMFFVIDSRYRRMERSFTSRICVSDTFSSVGTGTNSKVSRAAERNLSRAAR